MVDPISLLASLQVAGKRYIVACLPIPSVAKNTSGVNEECWFLVSFGRTSSFFILMLMIAFDNIHVGIGCHKWIENSHIKYIRPFKPTPPKAIHSNVESGTIR